jgi:lysyl oxidase
MRLSHLAGVALCLLAAGARALSDDCDPTDPTLLMPTLVARRPTQLRWVYFGTHRQLNFSSTIGNAGVGPLILHAQTIDMPSGSLTQVTQEVRRTDGSVCTHAVGLFEHAADDLDWHVENFMRYQLRKDDPLSGAVVAESSKTSFCIEDDRHMRGFRGNHQVESDCGNPEGTQGLSPGYQDVYRSFLPNQWIDLDADPENPVPAGKYFLVNVPDPNDQFLKTSPDPATDYGVVKVRVRSR